MDKYERFEAWLRENGGQFALLEMKEYEDGDGDDQGHHEELHYEEEEEKKEPSGYNFGSGPEEAVANHRHCSTASATNSNINNASSTQQNTQQQQQTEEEQRESEMRGVHARTHLPANTVCMSIPRKCLITVEMGQATPIGQLIAASDLDLDAPKHIYLMIYILWDRKVHGVHSFFHPYYEILPKTLSNMPIFWSEEEKAYLQGSYLLEQIQDRDLAITEDYQAICSIAPKLQDICTLEEFKWARMCVCSRNFGLSMDGHRTSALVPYADMLNHYRPRETKWTFDEDRQAFTITTLQQIPAGAQVYDSYGQKCNHRFLLNYGFAVEDNRELDGFCPNEVPIELSIAPNDPIYRLKLEFWLRGEPGNSFAHHPQLNHCSSMPSHSQLAAAVASVAGTTANQQNSTRAPTTTSMTTASRDALVTVVEAAVNYRNRQAAAQQQQQQQQYQYDFASAANLQSSAGLSKRVRVCVSNNENTRLLFSLLRAAVCNEDELVAITTPVTTISGTDVIMSSAGLFGMGRPLPPQVPPLAPSFLETVTSPSSQSTRMYYRSCRDIRHPISIRNERAAMQLLLDTVGRQLSQYPTSLVQDVSDLMDERAFPRFSNQRHAKIQVRGEKEVLHHFGQWARTALNVLQVIENELVQERQAISAAAYASGPASASASRSTPLNDTAARGSSNFWTLGGSAASTSTTLRRTATNNSAGTTASANNRVGMDSHFDYIIQSMEEEETGLHHTIVRYCADVLGSLRREEFKNLRRQRALWTNHSGGDNHNNNNNQGYA